MSHVTNIIVTTFPDDDLFVPKFGLLRLDELCGGDKNMECDVYLSAMNDLSLDKILSWFKTTPFEFPEYSQLLYKEQNDDLFTMVYREDK